MIPIIEDFAAINLAVAAIERQRLEEIKRQASQPAAATPASAYATAGLTEGEAELVRRYLCPVP